MIRADDEPQRMRRDDADEADHAGLGHACTDRDRDEKDDRGLEALQADAEMERFGFAESKRIESAQQVRATGRAPPRAAQ